MKSLIPEYYTKGILCFMNNISELGSMPVTYMVYGSFALLAIALVIYLFNLKKRR